MPRSKHRPIRENWRDYGATDTGQATSRAIVGGVDPVTKRRLDQQYRAQQQRGRADFIAGKPILD